LNRGLLYFQINDVENALHDFLVALKVNKKKTIVTKLMFTCGTYTFKHTKKNRRKNFYKIVY